MDENDDIRRIMPILIREICVNLCPIFRGTILTNSEIIAIGVPLCSQGRNRLDQEGQDLF